MTEWDPLCGTDWTPLLRSRLGERSWAELRAFVQKCSRDPQVYPPPDSIFAALCLTELAKTKVVVVGQDPYPGAGQANGLAFAVPDGQGVPRTLKNIYRELNCDVCVPVPTHGNLEPWARHGVLLLNATLTIRNGAAAEHQSIWKPFTDAVIQVAEEVDPVFILWGKVAKEKTFALIDEPRRMVITSPHPSPLSAYKGFFGSKPFSRANQALIGARGEGIDWRL